MPGPDPPPVTGVMSRDAPRWYASIRGHRLEPGGDPSSGASDGTSPGRRLRRPAAGHRRGRGTMSARDRAESPAVAKNAGGRRCVADRRTCMKLTLRSMGPIAEGFIWHLLLDSRQRARMTWALRNLRQAYVWISSGRTTYLRSSQSTRTRTQAGIVPAGSVVRIGWRVPAPRGVKAETGRCTSPCRTRTCGPSHWQHRSFAV
jgi:hypothetical protein